MWFGSYAGVTAVGGLYFWFGSDAVAKRQSYPWFLGVTVALLAGFLYFGIQAPIGVIVLVGLFASLGAVTHARTTTFCSSCARMVNRGLFGTLANFCPRCGRALDKDVLRGDASV